jgi:hypothetical protein
MAQYKKNDFIARKVSEVRKEVEVKMDVERKQIQDYEMEA